MPGKPPNFAFWRDDEVIDEYDQYFLKDLECSHILLKYSEISGSWCSLDRIYDESGSRYDLTK